MRTRRCFLLLVAGLLVVTWGCTTDSYVDDPDGAPVTLEIQIQDNPPVTTQADPLFGCTFLVTDWTATALNVPKNAEAVTSPFNDIIMESVTIEYFWDGGSPATPTRLVPLTATVPANSSVGLAYVPIYLDDVVSEMEGRTATLTMTFRARTVAGERISFTTGDTLSVNACVSPPPGG